MITGTPLRSRRSRCLLAALLGLSLPASGTSGAARDDRAVTILTRSFGLSSADMRRIDAGAVVARTLDSDDGREVATLGVVRIAVPPEFFARRLADIAAFKKNSEAVLQIGTFRNPPHEEDLRALTLDPSDIDDLRDCRVADCDVQLPADAIERFRTEVNWKASGADQQAGAVMRSTLVGYVRRYRTSGEPALVTYADKSKPIAVGREFRDLVEDDRRVLPQFPGLRQYLLAPAAAPGAMMADVVYWSKERIGRKPVLSVTHLVIWRPPPGSPAEYVAASKQLYASHYFDASLGLTMMIGGGGASPATYVAYLNRSRVDMFGGVFGGVTRALVKSKTRGAAADNMERLKTGLERAFRRGD